MLKVVNLVFLILAPLMVTFRCGAEMKVNLALLGVLLILLLMTYWAIRKSRAEAGSGADMEVRTEIHEQ